MNILQHTIEFVILFREIFVLALTIVLLCSVDFIFKSNKKQEQSETTSTWLDEVAKDVIETNRKELWQAQAACLEHVNSLEQQIENRQRALSLLNGEEAERVNQEVLDYSNQMLRLI
tara:strand:- start:5122 stop:5472 length:351 start_codon:yes stop_codon:yes gene_type:complete